MFDFFKKKKEESPIEKNLEVPKPPSMEQQNPDQQTPDQPETSVGKKEVKEIGALGVPPSPPNNQEAIAKNMDDVETAEFPVPKVPVKELPIKAMGDTPVEQGALYMKDEAKKEVEEPPEEKAEENESVEEEPKAEVVKLKEDEGMLPQFDSVTKKPPKKSDIKKKMDVDKIKKEGKKESKEMTAEEFDQAEKVALPDIYLLTQRVININRSLSAKINGIRKKQESIMVMKKTYEQEIRKTRTKIEDQFAKERKNLENSQESQDKKISDLKKSQEKKIESLNKSLNEFKKKQQSLITKQTKEFDRLIDKKDKEHEELIKANKDLGKDNHKLLSDTKEMKDKYESLSKLVTHATASIRKIMEEDKTLFEEVSELRTLTSAIRGLKTHVKELLTDVNSLKKEILDLREVIDKNNSRVNMVREKINLYMKKS